MHFSLHLALSFSHASNRPYRRQSVHFKNIQKGVWRSPDAPNEKHFAIRAVAMTIQRIIILNAYNFHDAQETPIILVTSGECDMHEHLFDVAKNLIGLCGNIRLSIPCQRCLTVPLSHSR